MNAGIYKFEEFKTEYRKCLLNKLHEKFKEKIKSINLERFKQLYDEFGEEIYTRLDFDEYFKNLNNFFSDFFQRKIDEYKKKKLEESEQKKYRSLEDEEEIPYISRETDSSNSIEGDEELIDPEFFEQTATKSSHDRLLTATEERELQIKEPAVEGGAGNSHKTEQTSDCGETYFALSIYDPNITLMRRKKERERFKTYGN